MEQDGAWASLVTTTVKGGHMKLFICDADHGVTASTTSLITAEKKDEAKQKFKDQINNYTINSANIRNIKIREVDVIDGYDVMLVERKIA